MVSLVFTLPLVLDLRPGTVRCKLVSCRQLGKEFLMVPNISSLLALLITASKDKGCCFWCGFQSAIADTEVVEKFLNLDFLVLKENIEGIERVLIGTLGLMVWGEFKPGRHWAIPVMYRVCRCSRWCSYGVLVSSFPKGSENWLINRVQNFPHHQRSRTAVLGWTLPCCSNTSAGRFSRTPTTLKWWTRRCSFLTPPKANMRLFGFASYDYNSSSS